MTTLGQRLLNSRELEVVRAAAAGLTSHETGAQLQLATQTIERYRTNAMRKLNVRNITQAAVEALRRGYFN